MTNLERRALLGDPQAQEECTRRGGIVLGCPLCGSIYTQVRRMGGWSEPAQAFEAGYRGECTVCHAVSGAHKTEQEALTDWNTRPAPPIGRCGECSRSEVEWTGERTCNLALRCVTVQDDYFCASFKPKEDNSNG